MRFSSLRAAALSILFCLASVLLTSPPIAAADSKYPPDAAARGFNGGSAGWTDSSSFDGSCLPPLLCPSVANSFQASGGADAGGFIRSAYTGVAGVTAVAGTTTAAWASPTFAYAGDGGQDPGQLSFRLDRRASVDQLLAVAGNSATYSVRLVDLSAGGEAISLIPPTTLAGANDWRAVSRSVDPGRLVLGNEYRLLIATTYVTGTSVLVSGNADYDNVTLSADGGEGKGGKKKGGRGPVESRELLALLRGASPGTATLAGERLLVAVKCPRRVGRACRITAQGLLRKGKAATARRTVQVPKGKRRLLALRVKPGARRKVAKRKRLLVRQKVRVGRSVATLTKSRKLIRRGD